MKYGEKHNHAFDPPKVKPTPVYAGFYDVKDPKTGEIRTLPINPGLTKREMAADADINNIMKKYESTGVLPIANKKPIFGDFASIGTYQESLELVNYAQQQFDSMPAQLRARFQNDPGKFIEFAQNPANQEELYNLGLATRPEPKGAGNAVPAPKKDPAAGTPEAGGKA